MSRSGGEWWRRGLLIVSVAVLGASLPPVMMMPMAQAQECQRWAGARWAGEATAGARRVEGRGASVATVVAGGASGIGVVPGRDAALLPVAEDCTLTREREGERIVMQAGAWRAVCTEGRGCALPGPAVEGQRWQISRQLQDAAWRIVLSLPVAADAGAGLRLSIDEGEAENLPPEFVQAEEGGRVIAVRPEVAEAVLDMLAGARRSVTWHYTTVGGERRRFTLPAACLGRTLKALRRQWAMLRAMQRMGK